MEFLIIASCIIVVGAYLTFIFYLWLKLMKIKDNPDEVEIDFEIYSDSGDD